MGALGFLIAVILCGFIVALTNWWDNRKDSKIGSDPNIRLYDEAIAEVNEDKNKQKTDNSKMLMDINKGTRDLFMATLTKIGCQYELAEEEDDDRIFFDFQGEHFWAIARNDRKYIQIYDPQWEHVELYDIDEFARLKKAINGSNLNNSVTTVYTIDEEGKSVDVHSKSIVYFASQIPDIIYTSIKYNLPRCITATTIDNFPA